MIVTLYQEWENRSVGNGLCSCGENSISLVLSVNTQCVSHNRFLLLCLNLLSTKGAHNYRNSLKSSDTFSKDEQETWNQEKKESFSDKK